jgi:BirA family transcriptional regulator, biotin operon repressor / biotin---[acetyl-CoA-carboxylase] ligase
MDRTKRSGLLLKRIHFSTIDSTQTWVREHLKELPTDELVLVTADEQSAGRGQFQRSWLSPPGVNLYGTFYFLLPAGQQNLENMAQLLALSAATVLLEMSYPIQIKWPNDLLIEEKKLGGALVETVPDGSSMQVIAGIGININMSVEQLTQIDQPATSLAAYSGTEQAIAPLIDRLAVQFEEDLTLFRAEGFPPFQPLLKQLLGRLSGL